jgi:hypothetical protein
VDTQHFIDDFKPSKFKTPGRNFCLTIWIKTLKNKIKIKSWQFILYTGVQHV